MGEDSAAEEVGQGGEQVQVHAGSEHSHAAKVLEAVRRGTAGRNVPHDDGVQLILHVFGEEMLLMNDDDIMMI